MIGAERVAFATSAGAVPAASVETANVATVPAMIATALMVMSGSPEVRFRLPQAPAPRSACHAANGSRFQKRSPLRHRFLHFCARSRAILRECRESEARTLESGHECRPVRRLEWQRA